MKKVMIKKIPTFSNIYKARIEYGVKGLYKKLISEAKEEKEITKAKFNMSSKSSIHKVAFQTRMKEIKIQLEKDKRQLNPAKAQIRKVYKTPISSSYLKFSIKHRGESTEKFVTKKTVDKKSRMYKRAQYKKNEIIKQLKNQANRFAKYGKTFNLNNLTITYNSKKTTINTLLEISNRYLHLTPSEKRQYTITINKAIEKIKLIQPSKANNKEFSLSGNLDKVITKLPGIGEIDDTGFDERGDYADLELSELNGWVLEFKGIPSSSVLLEARIKKFGKDPQNFDAGEHIYNFTESRGIKEEPHGTGIANALNRQARSEGTKNVTILDNKNIENIYNKN